VGQAAEVTPIGDSSILMGSQWFTGYAREPLAQEWQALDKGQPVGTKFVTVVNHFKSKGSLAKKFENDEDEWQGNNNLLRIAQAQEVTNWVAAQFAGKPTILLGDLNSYSKEDPVLTIEEAGYTSVADMFNIQNASYLFGARVGSLDHGLANDLAKDLVVGADVWDVNAMEPLAFEYSRYNYNVKADQLFDLTPYRSSDHNPLKMGLKTFEKMPEPGDPGEDRVVTPAAPEFINPSASDPASCTVKPFATVKDMEGVKYTVTVDGKELKANAEGKFVYPYGKTIIVKAEPVDGFTFAPNAKTEWSWTAMMNDKCNTGVSKPLAKTGVDTGLLALFALVLASAGMGAVRASRVK
ncbi:nuclease, partial [Gleimia europaea]|nr:nuclease [Gleimia europaea]